MRYSAIASWLLAATLLGGCGAGTPTAATSETAAPTEEASAPETDDAAITAAGGSCSVDKFEEVGEDGTLTMGPTKGIPETTAKGEPMVIVGLIVDYDCVPLPETTIHVWQTDGDGVYGPGQDSNGLECCYLQGDVTTDDRGRFKLITVRPGYYKGETAPPPAHIHVEGQGMAASLLTEIVFKGDPYLTPGLDGYVVVDLTQPDGVTWTGLAVLVLEF